MGWRDDREEKEAGLTNWKNKIKIKIGSKIFIKKP